MSSRTRLLAPIARYIAILWILGTATARPAAGWPRIVNYNEQTDRATLESALELAGRGIAKLPIELT